MNLIIPFLGEHFKPEQSSKRIANWSKNYTIKIMKKYFLIFLAAVLILAGFYFFKKRIEIRPKIDQIASELKKVPDFILPAQTSKESLPDKYLIKNFPFQSQAPTGNWDKFHDEACEEASLVLVKYFSDKKPLSAEKMDQELGSLVKMEELENGEQKNLNVLEVQKLAQKAYGLNSNIKSDISIEQMEQEISQDHPLILPTAGRLLGNPNFRWPGPVYHMVVAIGYTQNDFIVQDVGTRHGKLYYYKKETLFNAIHDWAGNQDNILSGAKVMLIFR